MEMVCMTTDSKNTHETGGPGLEQRVTDLESKLEDMELVVVQLMPVQKGWFGEWLLKQLRR